MKKRFKTKRVYKINFKILVYFLLIIVSFNSTLNLLLDDKKSIKDFLLSALVSETKNEGVLLSTFADSLTSPKEIIYKSLNKMISKDNLSVMSNIEDDFFSYDEANSDYVSDPNPTPKSNKPIIYIYNTHQLEEYEQTVSYEYSVKPNVMIASYVLKEKLNNLGLSSIVETNNIKEYLNNNNLKYSYSYVASRYFLESAILNNPTLTYFIDIHRDSATRDKTYYKKDDKEYARILFVVGMEHENYQKNLDLAMKLNTLIEKEYPGLSRGISKKQGSNVNGIYNQDISENSMLIEVGGVDNLMEEVYNTCDVIANYLFKIIGDNYGN